MWMVDSVREFPGRLIYEAKRFHHFPPYACPAQCEQIKNKRCFTLDATSLVPKLQFENASPQSSALQRFRED